MPAGGKPRWLATPERRACRQCDELAEVRRQRGHDVDRPVRIIDRVQPLGEDAPGEVFEHDGMLGQRGVAHVDVDMDIRRSARGARRTAAHRRARDKRLGVEQHVLLLDAERQRLTGAEAVIEDV